MPTCTRPRSKTHLYHVQRCLTRACVSWCCTVVGLAAVDPHECAEQRLLDTGAAKYVVDTNFENNTHCSFLIRSGFSVFGACLKTLQ